MASERRPWLDFDLMSPGVPPLPATDRLRALEEENALLRDQLAAVSDIGLALSAERDLRTLLETILTKSRWLTNADAGSLYLLEGEKRDSLRFVLAQNDSRSVPFVERVLPIAGKTIVGWVARNRKAVNIHDVYHLPPDADFAYSTHFDEQVGYRCKSMLVVPMIDRRDRVTGCIQLINRKPTREQLVPTPADVEQHVLPFPDGMAEILRSIASQSAVAIDKARLIDDLEHTFEGMVYASVVAIESRDPTTSGHSERVAKLSCDLAKAVSDHPSGKFGGTVYNAQQLKELRYASLLHDFGKVGVREHVLIKAKKLYPWDLDSVKLRFAVAVKEREAQVLRSLVTRLGEAGKGVDPRPFIEAAESTIAADRTRLLGLLETVLQANEPKVLADGKVEELRHIGNETFLELDGQKRRLLTDEEVHDLQIPKGSLNREQRLEIESHVAHTYRFLSRIPWTEELRDLPRIAGAHHEKLDGSGYPHGLTDAEIPTQSKIMAIADVFDALTAWDRPYKKAMPLDRALAVLDMEAKERHLDGELVDLFKSKKIYRLVLPDAP
jgi:HD-GYP domain-containing protein (c-di-GMP phosphodiesterase class II)